MVKLFILSYSNFLKKEIRKYEKPRIVLNWCWENGKIFGMLGRAWVIELETLIPTDHPNASIFDKLKFHIVQRFAHWIHSFFEIQKDAHIENMYTKEQFEPVIFEIDYQ